MAFFENVASAVKSFLRSGSTGFTGSEVTADKPGSAVMDVIERQAEIMANTPNLNPTPENPTVLHEHCKRCGRILKNHESQILGFGTVCYRKHLKAVRTRPLFEVKKPGDHL